VVKRTNKKDRRSYSERGLDLIRGFECPEPDDFWEARKQNSIEPGLRELSYEMVKLSLEDLLAPIYKTRANHSEQEELVRDRRTAYFWMFRPYRKNSAQLSLDMCCDILCWDCDWLREAGQAMLTEFTEVKKQDVLSKGELTALSRNMIRKVLGSNGKHYPKGWLSLRTSQKR
jgi:hypothetical protein